VREKGVDWAKRHEVVRQDAWREGEELIAMARDFKDRWRREVDRLPGFECVVRALELAFKLKQFAAGMPAEVKQVNTMVSGADGGPIRVEVEAALKKIYGKPLPGEVVEAEVVSNQSAVISNQKGGDGSQRLLTSSPTEGGKE
jgi:hypothetical protein